MESFRDLEGLARNMMVDEELMNKEIMDRDTSLSEVSI